MFNSSEWRNNIYSVRLLKQFPTNVSIFINIAHITIVMFLKYHLLKIAQAKE